LYLNPALLLLSHKHIAKFFFFLDCIKVINNNSYKQVYNKLGAYNHERHKIENSCNVGVSFRLQIDSAAINARVHDFNPSFSRCHLEKCVHSNWSIVEICIFVDPRSSEIEAILLGVHHAQIYFGVRVVTIYAVVKLPFEESHSHDAENQDEEGTH
jgi:hypothetical protein